MRITTGGGDHATQSSYTGQSRQWKGHHKKICKPYNSFVSSADFRGLSTPERVDSILLSQLVAQVYPDGDFTFPPKIESPSLTLFLDLLPRLTANGRHALPVCTPGKVYPTSSAIEPFLSRFGNNNFLLHSHLTSFAHGIYPLASRVMNHSCYPNSVARYKIRQGESPVMEVVTLNKIHEGEEVRRNVLVDRAGTHANRSGHDSICRPGSSIRHASSCATSKLWFLMQLCVVPLSTFRRSDHGGSDECT